MIHPVMGDGATLKLGRYESIRQLAQGGMATVYLGRALGVGGFQRLVAIKQMHPHFATEETFVSMFLDEARLTAKIRHPNVVPVLDIDEGEGGLFIVMDFVDGASLFRIQKTMDGARMPLSIALRIVLDVLAGLHAAHELVDEDGTHLAIVHRDVSPHNVLVGTDGVSRISDFGVAKAAARIHSTGNGALKGKVSYMSPEQLRGTDIDRRVDVYGVGVVLWELLAGRRLFPADDDMFKVMHLVSLGAASSPGSHADVPDALDAACMKALAPLEARFGTAQEFSDALELAAASCGIVIAKTRDVAAFAKGFAVDLGVLPKMRDTAGAFRPHGQQRSAPEPLEVSARTLDTSRTVSTTERMALDPDQTMLESSHVLRPSMPVASVRRLGIAGVVTASLVLLALAVVLAMPGDYPAKHTELRQRSVASVLEPEDVPRVPSDTPSGSAPVNPTAPTAASAAMGPSATMTAPTRRLPVPATTVKRGTYKPRGL